jgi:hypothetical protein
MIRTCVLATYAAKIMDVIMHLSVAMITTPVLLILVIHMWDVKTSRSLVMMVMNALLIDATVNTVANTSLLMLKITLTVLDGNPSPVHLTLTARMVVLVLKILASKESVTL